MDFEKVILKRRMVRNFKPDPIPPGAIERIMSLAQHAPSAGFSQGSAYVVVTDANMRRKIGELHDEDRYAFPFISRAPVVIVACVSEKIYHDRYQEPDKLRSDGTELEWPVPYWYFDIGCGCMIVLLAAANEGLSAGFVGTWRIEDLRTLLGIPSHFHPVGVMPVGHRDKDVLSPSLKRGRRPNRDVVHYEHW